MIACDGLWDTVSPDAAKDSVFKSLKDNKGRTDRNNRMIEQFSLGWHKLLVLTRTCSLLEYFISQIESHGQLCSSVMLWTFVRLCDKFALFAFQEQREHLSSKLIKRWRTRRDRFCTIRMGEDGDAAKQASWGFFFAKLPRLDLGRSYTRPISERAMLLSDTVTLYILCYLK